MRFLNQEDIKKAILSDGMTPKIPDSCPAALKDLIVSCWSRDPSQRPSLDHITQQLESLRSSQSSSSSSSTSSSSLEVRHDEGTKEETFASLSHSFPLHLMFSNPTLDPSLFTETSEKSEGDSDRANSMSDGDPFSGLIVLPRLKNREMERPVIKCFRWLQTLDFWISSLLYVDSNSVWAGTNIGEIVIFDPFVCIFFSFPSLSLF